MIISSVIAALLATTGPGEITPTDRVAPAEPAPLLAWKLPHYPGMPSLPSIPRVPRVPRAP